MLPACCGGGQSHACTQLACGMHDALSVHGAGVGGVAAGVEQRCRLVEASFGWRAAASNDLNVLCQALQNCALCGGTAGGVQSSMADRVCVEVDQCCCKLTWQPSCCAAEASPSHNMAACCPTCMRLHHDMTAPRHPLQWRRQGALRRGVGLRPRSMAGPSAMQLMVVPVVVRQQCWQCTGHAATRLRRKDVLLWQVHAPQA